MIKSNITASMVGKLRSQTGAGVKDCKEALDQTDGDFDKAIDFLRKKGIESAGKKADRATAEGLIKSYIHTGNKIGVLLEIKCETDFVAKNEEFKELARDLCMHIAATAPQFISRDDVSKELIDREREIAAAQVKDKPAAVVQKIVTGKLEKFYAEICLMEQPFVKDPDHTVKDLLSEKISKIGENLVVSRFTRYQLGE